jgi:signal transduction histidine kinase
VPLDVTELACRATDSVDPGTIALALRADGPAPRIGDPIALERALTNVVENAVRHARTRVDVIVRHADGDGAVVVEVADDGPGFAPEDLPHVFEPLFRGDRARKANGAGAGLGLAIARRLARAHGGEISAENRPQGGARITVTLP